MCMGPPRCPLQRLHRLWVYPHVYGATLPVVMAPASILGLSPCVWGHPQTDRFQPIDPGSIPMCMGPLVLPRFHGQVLVCVFGFGLVLLFIIYLGRFTRGWISSLVIIP